MLAWGSSPSNPTQLTVAFWMRKATDVGAAFVSKPFAATGSNTFQVDTEPNRTLRFITYNGMADKRLVQETAFTFDIWTHIAVTFDGTKKLFVNGSMATSSISELMVSDGSAMLIGCDHDTNAYVRFLRGILDEVIVFDVALTPAEVVALAQP